MRLFLACLTSLIMMAMLAGPVATAQDQAVPAQPKPSSPTPSPTPVPNDSDKGIKGLLGSDKDNDFDFREIAKDLRCPTCTGLSILESDASFSVQIKDQVHEQMKLGKSKKEIIKYFVERYGPWILREPPKEGFNILAWIIPIAILCLGPILIWLLVWRRRTQFNVHGVRSSEALVKEMHDRLLAMKESKK